MADTTDFGRRFIRGTKLNVVLIYPDYTTNKSTQSLLLETTKVDSPKTGKP